MELSNESELLEKWVNELKEDEKEKNLFPFFFEFLKYVYKDKPELLQKIQAVLPEDIDVNSLSTSQGTQKSRNLVGEYLKVMKVNFQENYAIDGFTTDFYLPDKKIIVKIHSGFEINFDKITLSGRGILKKRIYQSFDGYTPIFINFGEFMSSPEHMQKINYLIAAGIENQNSSGLYDFSSIDKSQTGPEDDSASIKIEEPEGETEESHEEEKKN